MKKPVRQPLRIVLVVDPDQRLSDAQAFLIDRLNANANVVFCGRVVGTKRRANTAPSPILRAVLACERILVRWRIKSYDTKQAETVLNDLPSEDEAPASKGYDLAIVLGAFGLPDDKLTAFKHGEWALTYGGSAEPNLAKAMPTLRDHPWIRVEIVKRSKTLRAPTAIRGANYTLKPGAVVTGAFAAEKAVLLLEHTINAVSDERFEAVSSEKPTPCPAPPGHKDAVLYAVSFLREMSRQLLKRLSERLGPGREYWRIAQAHGNVTEIDPEKSRDVQAHTQIMADPFLFEHEGVLWLFYEAMNGGAGTGWIEAAQLKDSGISAPVTALKRPYHLSFPYVFSEGSDIFMIPETQQARRLEVWKATHFPTDWELHATAFEGHRLAESSLFKDDDGQWWLLTNLSDYYAFQDHSSELYLYAVDGPDLKHIEAHPDNPVVFGADRARNAGAIFRHDGRLFRPTQDSSFGIYGYGLNLMEVTRLDAGGYEEKLIKKITPADKSGSTAIHHLSVVGDTYVFDWSGEH